MARQEELENEGWTRQFTAGEPRLSEAVAEYEELGFEVLLKPIDPLEMSGECSSCLRAAGDRTKIIYTRRRQ
ncbi:MAG: hypothetical protein V2B13_08580 [Pseudomonadota bacterium]